MALDQISVVQNLTLTSLIIFFFLNYKHRVILLRSLFFIKCQGHFFLAHFCFIRLEIDLASEINILLCH